MTGAEVCVFVFFLGHVVGHENIPAYNFPSEFIDKHISNDDIHSVSNLGRPRRQALENRTVTSDHDYYTVLYDPNGYNTEWIYLSQYPDHVQHARLSDSHRFAATITILFPFRFYGNPVDQVTIATGGYLYMSPFLHKQLTATQYIAPLMANFDTTLGNESTISYYTDETMLVVHWEKVYLSDQPTVLPFDFQVILRSDGSITFVYKDVPIAIGSINTDSHPVKVGVSDAYYVNTVDSTNITRRTIYEYHEVELDTTSITPLSSYKLMPIETCNVALTCDSCTNISQFSCRWCSVLNRCSNGFDWNRQEWLDQGCLLYSDTDCSNIPANEDICDPAGAVAACASDPLKNATFDTHSQCLRASETTADCLKRKVYECRTLLNFTSAPIERHFAAQRWFPAIEYGCRNLRAIQAGMGCLLDNADILQSCTDAKRERFAQLTLDMSKIEDVDTFICCSAAMSVSCNDEVCGAYEEFTTFTHMFHEPDCLEERICSVASHISFAMVNVFLSSAVLWTFVCDFLR